MPLASFLRVVLHDELLLDRDVYLLSYRELMDEDAHPGRQHLEPGRDDAVAMGLSSDDERRHLCGLAAHVDHVMFGHLE